MSNEPLGPMPPKIDYSHDECSEAYADWQRRRAERAEELLREAMDNNNCGCDDCQITRFRVKAHFKDVRT